MIMMATRFVLGRHGEVDFCKC